MLLTANKPLLSAAVRLAWLVLLRANISSAPSLHIFMWITRAEFYVSVVVFPHFATKEPRSYSLTPSLLPSGMGGKSKGKKAKTRGLG